MTATLRLLERNVSKYKCNEGCAYTCMYAQVCVCVCVWRYIYIYIYIYTLIICMFGFNKDLDMCVFKVFLCHVFYVRV